MDEPLIPHDEELAAQYCVDRIEDGIAILEDSGRHMLGVPADTLPPGAREGDCLRLTDGAYVIDEQETARRRKKNQDLLKSLLEN